MVFKGEGFVGFAGRGVLSVLGDGGDVGFENEVFVAFCKKLRKNFNLGIFSKNRPQNLNMR